jgi:dUTP pyrophosphatase
MENLGFIILNVIINLFVTLAILKHKKNRKRKYEVFFVKGHENAILPKQKDGDAAFDVCAIEYGVIPGNSIAKIRTGLKLAYMTSEACDGSSLYLQVMGRGGKALEGVHPEGGVVDANYRGEIQIIMYNSTSLPWSYSPGNKIAQLIINKVETNNKLTQIDMNWTDSVISTSRGENGFGSSGA